MEQILKREVCVLIGAIVDAAETHIDRQEQVPFEFGCDLSSDCADYGAQIAKELELSFPRTDLQAIVEVEVHKYSLGITVSCLSPYVSFQKEGAWFVDIPGESCWRFVASDQGSAVNLASYLNSAPHAKNVRSLLPKSGLDVDTLNLWMLDLSGRGISVSSFEHKKI